MNVKSIKKGFTLTELIIVIVIIGILAGVLIPTFINVVNKANRAADISLIRNLNEALTLDRYDNGEHKHMTATLNAVEEYGFDVTKIDAKVSKNKILWDSKNDVFCYLDGNDIEYYPNSVDENDKIKLVADYYKLWIITGENPATSIYSVYYTGELSAVEVNDVGFDAGKSNVGTVNYTGTKGRTVVIRTNSFSSILIIDAPNDTVKHFDYAASVNVKDIKDTSYDEYGTVGRIKVEKGHVEMMPESEVFCLMEAPSSENAVKSTTVNEGATIHKESTNINAANGINKNDETGVANGHVDDCGAGRHAFSELIVDSEHVYDVCTCCGYTLIRVIDGSGTEIKQTKNTLVPVVETVGEEEVTRYVVNEEVGEVVTPVETYQTNTSIPTKVEGDETVVDVEQLSGANVDTDGNNGEPLEETPVVVSEDEDGKQIAIDRTCKHEFSYSDYLHETDDICLGTCKKCGLKIQTTHDWVVKTQLPGQTEYDGVCSKCGCVRETYVAQIVGGGKFATLPEAFAALEDNATATIKLIGDEKFDIYSSALTVKANQNITFDLNGYTLLGYCSQSTTSALIRNNGTLILLDSTDTLHNGTGSGKMSFAASAADSQDIPSYASNIISNYGTLTVESGLYNNNTDGGYASYTIDNYSGGDCTINGGKFIQDAYKTYAVRMFLNSTTTDNKLTVNDGIIEGGYGLWVQYTNNDPNKAKLFINGGTFIGHDGSALYVGGTPDVWNIEYVTIDISGGTFIGGAGDFDVYVGASNSEINYGYSFSGFKLGNYVSISGGNIGRLQMSSIIKKCVSGGIFKSFNNGGASAYLLDGFHTVDNGDGTISVVPD